MNIKEKNTACLYIFLVLSGLAGTAVVLAATSLYGPGITHDSAAYIYAAKSLLQGNGYEYFGYPSPFIQWPPLFPTLLAAAGLIGLEPVTAVNCINAAAHGLIILFGGYWLYTRLKHKLFMIVGVLVLMFSVPLLQVSKYLWTETLFLLFFLLFYIKFENFLKTHNYKALAAAGIFTAFTCLDRYAGVTIVLTASLYLLFQKKTFLKRVIEIFIYGVVSVLPMGIWVIRNYIVSSTLLGVRIPSTFSLKLNIKRVIQSVFTWIQPDRKLAEAVSPGIISMFEAFSVILPVAILASFAALIGYNIVRYKKLSGYEEGQDNRGIILLPIMFYSVFVIIYTVYLIASATTVAFEPINSRYLVPLYLPAVFVILAAADILTERLAVFLRPSVILGAAVAVSTLFIVYALLNTGAAIRSNMESGAGGYSAKVWHNNKLIGYMKQNPQDGTYYSNSADAVFALTGVRTFYPPKKSGPDIYGFKQFRQSMEKDSVSYFIWFKNGVPDTLYSIEDIGRLYKLEIVEQNSDGTVYRTVK